MEREIDSFFDEFPTIPLAYDESDMACDMYEEGGSLVIKMHMPGITRETISVRGEKGVVHIFGTREREEELVPKNYFRQEIRTGSQYRGIFIPDAVRANQAEIDYTNGVLTVRMPYDS